MVQAKWRSDYKGKANDSMEGSDARVLRGGSLLGSYQGRVRCASRNYDNPGSGFDDTGFRVVAVPGAVDALASGRSGL